MKKIAFIGGGNMARNLIAGLVTHDVDAKNIMVSNPGQEKLNQLAADFSVHITHNNFIAANFAEIIILAVKPQKLKEVVLSLADLINQKKPLVISIAAGITKKQLNRWLNDYGRLVIAMPNLPSKVGLGMTGLFSESDAQDKKVAETIFKAVGKTAWLKKESEMNILSAISGSGPALVFYLIETLRDAGINLGLTKETVNTLALQMVLGAVTMAEADKNDVIELRRQVTSPKGTTEQMIKILQEGKLDQLVLKAVKASIKRSEELSKEFHE